MPENIWRLTIAPDSAPGADPLDFCRRKGIVGIGWGQYSEEDLRADKIKSKTAKSGLRIFYDRMEKNDHVWLYNDQSCQYYIALITSEKAEPKEGETWDHFDIHHIREAEWSSEIPPEYVPGAIKRRFTSPGTTGRMKVSSTWNEYSRLLRDYSEKENLPGTDDLSNPAEYLQKIEPNQLADVLAPEELEDAVAFYLQVEENWKLIKSSAYAEQQAVECQFQRLADGGAETAYMQVKSGEDEVDFHKLKTFYRKDNHYLYCYPPPDRYKEEFHESRGAVGIEPALLHDFLTANAELLPLPVLLKLQLASESLEELE